jgi:hypothetical protein
MTTTSSPLGQLMASHITSFCALFPLDLLLPFFLLFLQLRGGSTKANPYYHTQNSCARTYNSKWGYSHRLPLGQLVPSHIAVGVTQSLLCRRIH